MQDNWTNFHSHTVFSMLDGHGQVENYAERADELGMTHLAITDHGNLHGWMDFYDACQEMDLTPIMGMEAYMARKTRHDTDKEELSGPVIDELDQRGPYHLTVVARNFTGYQNLIKLSSRAFLEGVLANKARIDYELLSDHADGLMVFSGCLNGPVAQALMRDDFQSAVEIAGRLQDIVGREHFFIEVMNHTIPEEIEMIPKLERVAREIGADIVPTGDCHYVRKEDSHNHDVMLCVSTGSKVDEEDRFKFVPEEFYLRSYNEMLERFPAEWLHNSMDAASMVERYEVPRGDLYFPEFKIGTGESPEEHFERLVWEGIENRYGDNLDREVIDRTLYEIRTIKRLGFTPYFLVVADLINHGKSEGVRIGYGRGSAAGSIVSYALNITNLDPLRFGLLFERFLLPEEVDYDPILEVV